MVVIGMLDPDPRVYGLGWSQLKEVGIAVRFFPDHLRDRIKVLNHDFIMKYRASPTASGRVSFDPTENNSRFIIGQGV